MRAVILIALIPLAFSATLPESKFGVPALKDVAAAPKDLSTDVAVSQALVSDQMRDLFVRRNNQLQLHYLLIIDVGNRAYKIRDSLLELQITTEVIDSIINSILSDYSLYLYFFNGFMTSLEEVRSELLDVNSELTSLDPILSESYTNLTAIHGFNNDDFDSIQYAVNGLIGNTETEILAAINGLSGQPVIDIYVVIQDIKNVVTAKQEDLQNARVLYDVIALQTLNAIKIVADQLAPPEEL